MKLAVVGSRQGADLEHVRSFLRELWQSAPHAVLVSGGNHSTERSVDWIAEQTWLELGGKVLSFRPKQISPEEYGIQVWELGGDNPRVYDLLDYPTGATYKDACLLRDTLIAETGDRLVAFYKHGRSMGASFTQAWARDMGRQTFAYEAAA